MIRVALRGKENDTHKRREQGCSGQREQGEVIVRGLPPSFVRPLFVVVQLLCSCTIYYSCTTAAIQWPLLGRSGNPILVSITTQGECRFLLFVHLIPRRDITITG